MCFKYRSHLSFLRCHNNKTIFETLIKIFDFPESAFKIRILQIYIFQNLMQFSLERVAKTFKRINFSAIQLHRQNKIFIAYLILSLIIHMKWNEWIWKREDRNMQKKLKSHVEKQHKIPSPDLQLCSMNC